MVRETCEKDRDSDPVRVKLEFYLSLQGAALFQMATRALCEREGRRLSPGDIFEWILVDWLSGLVEESRDSVLEEARRDVETHWAAADVVETPCPGNPEVTLVSEPHWTKRINFNPDSRHVTDAQRKLLLRRDGYRCSPQPTHSTPRCVQFISNARRSQLTPRRVAHNLSATLAAANSLHAALRTIYQQRSPQPTPSTPRCAQFISNARSSQLTPRRVAHNLSATLAAANSLHAALRTI